MVVGGQAGVVTSAHPWASETGAAMLRSGGNAADAAVAAALALGVVDPCNSGLGGYGGFAVCYLRKTRQALVIDFNSAVPAGFTGAGAKRGWNSVSVPGVPAGLQTLLETCGTLSRAKVGAPAIRFASQGFPASRVVAAAVAEAEGRLDPETARIFLPRRRRPAEGDILANPEYAVTLEAFAAEGAGAFYTGRLGQLLAEAAASGGGAFTLSDLASYHPRVLQPLSVRFAGVDVLLPGAGSGGPLVADVLLELENAALECLPWRGAAAVTRVVSAFRTGWGRRLGLTPQGHTTHLTTSDSTGNMVALTLTHGPYWFGSGLTLPGTGMVLNNGLSLGRPLAGDRLPANMCPCVLLRDGEVLAGFGTPGGRRIPTMVANFVLDVAVWGMSLQEAIAAPRFHNEGGREVWLEAGLPWSDLQRQGCDVQPLDPAGFYGPANGIEFRDGEWKAAVDVRWPGFAAFGSGC